MAENASAQSNIGTIIDDEWEYEYDYEETETVYVTLDFTPDASAFQPGGRRRKNNQDKNHQKDNQEGSTAPITRESTAQASKMNSGEEEGDFEQDASARAETHEKLQILDLTSRNPIISRNGKVFSATWGRTIGTDMIISTPGATGGDVEPVVRDEAFDVISLSRLKLVAKPVTLMPKPPGDGGLQLKDQIAGQAADIGTSVRNSSVNEKQTMGNEEVPRHTNSLLKPNPGVAAAPPKSRQKQFLDRFAELRRQKGQQKPVLIRSGRNKYEYAGQEPPSNGSPSSGIRSNETAQEPEVHVETVREPESTRTSSRLEGDQTGSQVSPDRMSTSPAAERAESSMYETASEEGSSSLDEGQDIIMTDDQI